MVQIGITHLDLIKIFNLNSKQQILQIYNNL